MWEYDATFDTWIQKTSCPVARSGGICFVINNKGYVGGGFDTVANVADFWEYTPATDSWAQKATIPAPQFIDAGAFAIGNYGYVTCGEDSTASTYHAELWQYNPALNQWVTKTPFPSLARDEVAAFSIGNKGYIGWGGRDGWPLFSDLWEYAPDSAQSVSVNEITDYNIATTVYPNPFTTTTTISFEKQLHNATIVITNQLGQCVQTPPPYFQAGGKGVVVDMTGKAPGIYFYEVKENKNSVAKGKLEVE